MRLPKLNRQLTTELLSGLLVFLFAYTALSKLMSISFFVHQLHQFPYLGNFSTLVAWLIPLCELAVVIMLLAPYYHRTGLWGCLILLSIFTTYLMVMLTSHKQNLPCSCGGVLKYLSWGQHIGFNSFFILITLLGILIDKKSHTKNPSLT